MGPNIPKTLDFATFRDDDCWALEGFIWHGFSYLQRQYNISSVSKFRGKNLAVSELIDKNLAVSEFSRILNMDFQVCAGERNVQQGQLAHALQR